MRALASALILAAFACSKPSTDGSTSSTTSIASTGSIGSTSAVSAEPSVGVSKWSKDSTEPTELVSATDRVAYVTFEGGGYVFHRGAQSKRLPRDWFGVGPPRRDISISGDGRRLAVPAPAPATPMSVAIYDTDALRFFGRFDLPPKDAPDAGTVTAKISVDGQYVVWSFERHACMVTDIETKALDVDGAKHKKCGGS